LENGNLTIINWGYIAIAPIEIGRSEMAIERNWFTICLRR